MTYRIRIIEMDGDRKMVTATEFVQADSIAEADARYDARVYVEPMVPCAGCGTEMPQADPRHAKRLDGSAVYPDPDHAFDGIRCLSCGPA